MNNKRWIPLMLIVVAAILVMLFLGRGDGAAYTVGNTADDGVSLLFDTLQHMNYPVSIERNPLDTRASTNDVFLIIQPAIPLTNAMLTEMLEWVERGGRLIFLQNWPVTDIEHLIDTPWQSIGGFRLYQLGYGEVLTGGSFSLTNQPLMNNPESGRLIHATLYRWNADRIIFAEYYHGFYLEPNFIGSLPLIIRLLLLQILFASIMLVWHLGKRFGKPMPYYEAVEREENEYVRALARLYMKTGKRR
ncbi:MAG: DUF4350 domain-containing protein [Defluviitaleaceae bacterium]|nr:DUF4350 domain-containing protein [Defluviitaleaceae bacterium]